MALQIDPEDAARIVEAIDSGEISSSDDLDAAIEQAVYEES